MYGDGIATQLDTDGTGCQGYRVGINHPSEVAFLRQRQVPFSCDELVDRILCRTEELLADIDDLEQAYRLLKRRAEGDADPTPRAAP